ncbi:uncharacterized protein LOC126473382 isoform X4 [Schistocerca serialis cubense]|uniref:uncharacterized protein LOC126473382 isoform X4 n=1 Tax=Schistocerca serialis cubense TaxID=2023355 RepID=UPI00214F5225|nr:uncharacterized protein LOC126473382 isoform X4 [Schistocerca serialis cubense]
MVYGNLMKMSVPEYWTPFWTKVCPDTMLLQDFPDEILLEIFSRLPVKDIVTCALYVCKRWKAVCRSSALWKGREYRLTDKKRKCEIVEVAKLIPHLTTLFVGTGASQGSVLGLRLFNPFVKNIEVSEKD